MKTIHAKLPSGLRNLFSIAALTLMLTACGFLEQTPQQQFILTPAVPDAPLCAKPMRGQLLISMPDAGADLLNDRIALLFNEREVRYLAGAKWDAPAPHMLQRLLEQYFSSAGCFAGVGTSATGISADYRLASDVQRMHFVYSSATAAPTAELRLVVRIIAVNSAKIVAQKTISYSQIAAGTQQSNLFDAMDTAAAKVMVECVRWTKETLQAEK